MSGQNELATSPGIAPVFRTGLYGAGNAADHYAVNTAME